ncbi:MAG: DUF4870 domain-containing protein [Planctomycetales bacterium]|nr:DUF4870 domain-containing protein [Planctomycetales bacterium]NIP67999.1 DUF4870 domain-containing protein [Planctomycetales bacterium]
MVEQDPSARTMGMLCHLTGLTSFVGIPGFIGPLILWLVKKDEQPFVDDQGKESLNFQLTLLIIYVAAIAVASVTCGLGAPLLLLPIGLNLVFCILGTVKANDGQYYRYPVNIRMIK